MRLFIVRHGQTRWNSAGRYQGQQDTDLDEKGLAQARLTAARFANHPFKAVVTSPLKRTAVTASLIAEACGCKELIQLSGFQEINHGSWQCHTADEIKELWPDIWDAWHRAPETVKMPGPGGESLSDVQIRAMKAFDEVIAQFCQGDVCLVTHDVPIKMMICTWLQAPISSFWRFQIPNCSVSMVDFSRGYPRLCLLGDTSHLGSSFERMEQKSL